MSIAQSRIKLKSYRVLFNRNNHGYYHATLTSTLFSTGNAMSFINGALPNNFAAEIPLFINPEEKLTQEPAADLDLGIITNSSSSVTFNIQFFNSIQRQRYDKAIFQTNDPALTSNYYNISQHQRDFGNQIPLYLVPRTQYTDNDTIYEEPYQADDVWTDTNKYRADGTLEVSGGTYPTALMWVHTGVHVGNVDPQPGGKDYDESFLSQEERLWKDNSGGVLKGSGYRKGALIYPYAVDLVFEVMDY
jgi:hypothetical protein